MATPEQLAALLAEAETALHKLKIGKAVTVVEADGRRVHYAKTDMARLQAYRDDLSAQINGDSSPRYTAIGFIL